MSDIVSISSDTIKTQPTTTIDYVDNETQAGRMSSESIQEYIVIVNLPEDWDTVHNYIINENEIDGIPNRKVNCSNTQEFSLRTAIYEMSMGEADILKTHDKVESVELNPDKYPQPLSLFTKRYKKNVSFNKPILPAAWGSESILYENGIRCNWSNNFVNDPSSKPFQGVGIGTTDTTNQDLFFSVSGRNVDAVIIDCGTSILHPELIAGSGYHRVFDVILDGPYKVDPDFFNADPDNRLETVTIDGVTIGTRAKESVARDWWGNTGASYRSSSFSSLGTLSIPSTYTRIHAHSKNGTNSIVNSHGTSCASQIGGKSFGLAFECNIWNIRILLGGVGGVISATTGINACTIWHKAKKIQSNDPDPTLVNNSYGASAITSNESGVSYSHYYRGNSLTYVGTGSTATPPTNAGACRNNETFTLRDDSAAYLVNGTGDSGGYLTSASSSNSAAENAIAAGCIIVASAGNENQKLSDKNDVDFNNWYGNSSTYTNRVGGIQQGFSGDHDIGKGSIRVGALDCAVEPDDEKQGATKFSVRKVYYSNNGPMIDIFAPGEMTMAAGYASSEDYQRQDDSNFYDTWFNGTSAAGPNVCSVIALYLQSNRRVDQNVVRYWLNTNGCKYNRMSDPISGINDTGYWSLEYNGTYDLPSKANQSYNVRGNGNLRGAPNKILHNPYGHDTSESGYEDKVSSLSGSFSVKGSFSIINN